MPQAPDYLRKQFADDGEALDAIRVGYYVDKGFIIRPRYKGYEPSERENNALDYLWLEWDYGFGEYKNETI